MKLAIMQPYFFPYIGYWQLINTVDTFVIYDDVNFIRRGWINRNRILINQKAHLLTLPLEKSSPNKLINEIVLCDGSEKLIKTIFMAYKKAPYFSTTMPLIEEILYNTETNLALFLESSIRNICDYLGVQTKILVSSRIEKNNALRSQDKILNICGSLKADRYINAIGGQELYDITSFNKHGIELEFIKTFPFVYKQFGNPYIPSLSIIDVLMFNSSQGVAEQLKQYELVKKP